MKVDWRRRSPARPWLLLRPGSPWDWLLVEGGIAQRQGQGEPPANLQARVALIVPAEHCSHFQLPAPPGLRREEWPLLLEDRLLQGADEVVCGCLGREAGQVRLLTVARQHLEGWRGQCVEWGVSVECCWAEFQLLPAPEAGVAWCWQKPGGFSLMKGLSEGAGERWLAWPDVLGDVRVEPWPQLRRVPLKGRWPDELAPLDSLPGLFEQRRPRTFVGPSRAQRQLIVACLLLACTWGSLWLVQQWRQVKLWQAQVLAVTGEQAGPRQAAQALKRLREAELQQQLRVRQLADLQGRLQAWLLEHPGWRLQAVRFDGQRWHVRLEGEGAAPPWGEMASAVGAQVQVNGDASSTRVVFDLEVAT
ncbi:type II secretion system protein GspL [Pseudomonas sp. 39004]|jgi:general secretion pathway protein L|uniref:GspL/Epsl periplasmic domain-containing protein n=1 Tax=Pseudomonas sp. 39004 TaxID=2967213 RepID=UPI002363223C|nr:GspL/Epsl periplasmic domain-containing protein [Pseudomonas sp. 39004]MDD1959774.1 type II secretion system protein GspL [Pseudomonas sp. 39004]